MQLSGRPLLDNQHDHALFVGREDAIRKIEGSFRSGLNCLVIGDPGSGKTSLVRALMFRADQVTGGGDGEPRGIDRPGHFDYLYVRANEARTAVGLLTAILDVVNPGPRDRAREWASPITLLDELTRVMESRDDAGVDRDRFGAESSRESGGGNSANGGAEGGVSTGSDTGAVDRNPRQPAMRRTRVVILEDVSAAAGAEVFGALRDEIWQVDALWLATTSITQAAGLLRAPADVFFETTVQLGPLTEAEAGEMLRRRLEDPETVESAELIAIAAQSAGATPRRVLGLARELVGDPAVGGSRLNTGRGLRARDAAVAGLSRPGRMLVQELEALGWASASDERLLARMGWTRPRVVQVLTELRDRGLVQMREENTGRGRPRKVYRITPAAEFVDPTQHGEIPSGRPT